MRTYISPKTRTLVLTHTDCILASVGGGSGGGSAQETARAPKRVGDLYTLQ